MTSPFLDAAELDMLKWPVPTEYGETKDCIGSLIVRAPDYTNQQLPDYNIELAYSLALVGVDNLLSKAKSVKMQIGLQECRDTLLIAYSAFKSGREDDGYPAIQLALEQYKKLRKK